MPPTKLVSTERRVGEADRKRYGRAWQTVRDAAKVVECRAWRFESARDPELFVEFLEFGEGPDPRESGELASALRALQEFGPGDSREWLDAPVT